MKLLLFLLALLCLFLLLTRATPVRSAGATRPPARGGWLTSLSILMLRTVRGLLAVITLITTLVAFKFLLIFSASARANTASSQQDTWVAGGLLAGIGLLLYFLFWTAARLRTRVNQMHFERTHTHQLLLAKHWSF